MPTGPYNTITVGEACIGDIIPESAPEAPAHWSAFVKVRDRDVALNRVMAGGETIAVPAYDIPTVGCLVHFMDPQGARLSIAAYASPDT